MIIAAHIDPSKQHPSFLLESISGLAKQYRENHFIIFSDKETIATAKFTDNCTLVTISPVIKNSLLLHYWYQYKLPALLTMYNAAIFISENSVCSLQTNTAQVMVIKDDFLQDKKNPLKNKYCRYLKRNFSKFAVKAAAICVTKAFIGLKLIEHYNILAKKTTTILHGIEKAYQPINIDNKETILAKYTEGHEFFVCECSSITASNLITLLKAFSIFKKRLKSGMQLVLINKLNHNPIKDFHIYKYRQEVQIIPYESKFTEASIIAAAYAGIFLPAFISAQNWGLQCLQSMVPLITTDDENNRTIYEDAVIYAPIDEKKIAEYMMLLYKDETYRNVYIKKGQEIANLYNQEESNQRLWQTILGCYPN
ncbi:MAG: hypothetical protein ACOYLO_11650 [Ferruginibacter sp.]